MLIIGLTGGIGSGKTEVANRFAKLGIEIIDTDIIAHEIVKPGQETYQKILDHFGTKITNEDKTINRSKLREVVFKDEKERVLLEEITHPIIRKNVQEQIKQVKSPYCIVVIPLLVETGKKDYIDRVLVIDSPEELQIERGLQRDKTSEADIKAIMVSQVDRETRLAAADDIIVNEGSLENLDKQIAELDSKYNKMVSE